MSSILRDASGAWRARYRDPEGHQRSRNFVRKIDAEQFLTSVEHAKFSGTYVDPAAGRMTFREYAEEWRAIQIHRPSTAAQLETNFRLHILPHLGDRQLAAIRPSEIQAWVRSRSAVLKPRTVELLYRYLVAVLRAAVSDRLIAVNPATGIKLPKPEVQRVVPLETSVVEKLVEVIPGRYQALVVLAAGTGMRQGECLGLTVDRVDFLRRQLTVDRQMLLMPGGGPVFAPPKTQASYRVIPLPVAHFSVSRWNRWARVHERSWRGNPSNPILGHMAAGREARGCSDGYRISLASALLREPADPARGVSEGRPSSSRARECH